MKILGISPLDKDATASIVEDGRILYAGGEERFSRRKQHAGFPAQSIEAALAVTGTSPEDIDEVAYAFLTWDQETALIDKCIKEEQRFLRSFRGANLQKPLAEAQRRVPQRSGTIHGLRHPNQKMQKGRLKSWFYRLAGAGPRLSRLVARYGSVKWAKAARDDHRRWHAELESGLRDLGLLDKLKRIDHHLSHAANAYLASGFERALIVTLDGYGTGLAGSISLGEGGKIKRLHNLPCPHSLGTYYETVTASLGFNPTRHGGKIVGLAAYGDPDILTPVLLDRFEFTDGTFRLFQNQNDYFCRHLSVRFPMVDVAAAYQRALEVVACKVVKHWRDQTGCDSVVLSGGVAANVKLNQRIFEIDGVEHIFIYPNMGDGGCGTGAAMQLSWPGGVGEQVNHVYFGPSYSEAQIVKELDRAGLAFSKQADLASVMAQKIHEGKVVARFDGRMEYGPRALGNRSILYHARQPEVNHWLNQRLGRTEFMPFAPVTLWEARHKCYHHIDGAEHPAQFMTITFDCTDWMKESCPAAVHVDGTARPQLIRRQINPAYYDILQAYERLSGIPCLINTSFNMHEEPIVCTPQDAIRAFLEGGLDYLAIGPFLVPHPESLQTAQTTKARTRRTPDAVVMASGKTG